MKPLLFIPLSLVLAACAQPQYTVMNATPASPGVTGQATAWPDISTTEPTGEKSKDVAVIVAIEDYAFLPDVPGAIENANAWESYLKAQGFGKVFVLTDKQAPIEEIKRFTTQATQETADGGALWFVFIGHGAAVKDGSDGALIGMDAQQTIESIGSRSVSRTELLASLAKGKQSRTVVVLDTCFSGRDSGGELLAAGTQPVIPVSAAPQVAAGTVVLSAAGNDEVAGQLPGAQRPAFSYLLLGAMRGWADDGDGNVTAEEAVSWTRQQMRHLKGRQQTPGADGDSSLALATRATEKDPGIAALMKAGGAVTVAVPTTATGPKGGQMIDTNKGVTFIKPDDWGVGPVGMGVVLNLTNQYSGNSIIINRQKVRQAFAATTLGLPQTFDSQTLEVMRPPAAAEYGAVTGQESEYRITDTDPNMPDRAEHHIKFGTYQQGAAWSVTLMLRDDNYRDADYATLQKLIEGLQFRAVQ